MNAPELAEVARAVVLAASVAMLFWACGFFDPPPGSGPGPTGYA